MMNKKNDWENKEKARLPPNKCLFNVTSLTYVTSKGPVIAKWWSISQCSHRGIASISGHSLSMLYSEFLTKGQIIPLLHKAWPPWWWMVQTILILTFLETTLIMNWITKLVDPAISLSLAASCHDKLYFFFVQPGGLICIQSHFFQLQELQLPFLP